MLGGGQSKLWTQIKHLLPGNANGLVDGSKYSPLNEHKNSLNKVALKALSSYGIEKFRALASPALITEDGRLTVSDVIQTGSHSYAGRIFASSLKDAGPFAFSPAVCRMGLLFSWSPTHPHNLQPRGPTWFRLSSAALPEQARCARFTVLRRRCLSCIVWMSVSGILAHKKTHFYITCSCSGCHGGRA